MHNEMITFQLATHYLPKVALKLERLFLAIDEACQDTNVIVHHYALRNIIEILALIEKPELKSRFLKEFMRIEHILNKSQGNISNTLYAELFIQLQDLGQLSGRFGETIHQDPFLQSVNLAQTIQHHDCELYAPQLFLWLESEASRRKNDLKHWLTLLRTLYNTVIIYLALLRETATFETIAMYNSFYQRSLPTKTVHHIILLRMNKHCGLIPRMQVGHHGLNLRLCEANSMSEVPHIETTIELGICQL